jgi:hypothetical protein
MSEATKKAYEARAKKLTSLGITPTMILTDKEKTMELLNHHIANDNSRMAYLNNCVKMTGLHLGRDNDTYKFYHSIMRGLVEDIRRKRLKACKYNSEERSKIWEMIAQKREDSKGCRHDTEINRFILSSFYLNQVPKRAELGTVELIHKDDLDTKVDLDRKNYLVYGDEGKGMLYLNRYKTDKTHGCIKEELTKEFMDDLRVTLAKRPRRYLFVSEDDDGEDVSMRNNTFSNYVIRTFGIGVNDLRHIFISDEVANANGRTRIEMARRMGHTIEEQIHYEWT